MSTTRVALGLGGLLAAFGLGWFVGQRQSAAVGDASASQPAGARVRDDASLADENRRLRTALAQAKDSSRGQGVGSVEGAAAAAGVPATSAGPWRVLADLQQRKLANPSISFVNGAGKLSDAFATLFTLSDSERTTLQQAVDDACTRLTDLQRENATVTTGADGAVTIAIKSFATAGGVVYDDLLKAFAQTLGPDRNPAFVTLGSEQVERALGRFGAPERTITVSKKTEAGSPGVVYSVSEKNKLPNESSSSGSSARSMEDLENRIGGVVRLLPPEFGGGK